MKSGSAGAGGGQDLLRSIAAMVTGQQGGLTGLAEAFQQKGLGDIVSSWIGTGANLPISADQIQQVLGSEQIQAFAQMAGLSPDSAGSQLAELLPGVVDRLTPDGEIPKGSNLMSTLLDFLR